LKREINQKWIAIETHQADPMISLRKIVERQQRSNKRRQILYRRRFVLVGKIKAAMTGHTEPKTPD
jgi:hypothetical protein